MGVNGALIPYVVSSFSNILTNIDSVILIVYSDTKAFVMRCREVEKSWDAYSLLKSPVFFVFILTLFFLVDVGCIHTNRCKNIFITTQD